MIKDSPLTKDRYDIIIEKIDKLFYVYDNVERTLNEIAKDMALDRAKIDEVKRRQGAVDEGITTLLEYQKTSEDQIEKIVTDAVQKIVTKTVLPLSESIDTLNTQTAPIKPILKPMPKLSIKDKLFGFIKG